MKGGFVILLQCFIQHMQRFTMAWVSIIQNKGRQHTVAYDTFNTDTQKDYKVLLTSLVVGCIRNLIPCNNKHSKSS